MRWRHQLRTDSGGGTSLPREAMWRRVVAAVAGSCVALLPACTGRDGAGSGVSAPQSRETSTPTAGPLPSAEGPTGPEPAARRRLPATPPAISADRRAAQTPDRQCRDNLSRPGAVLVIGDSITVAGAVRLEAELARAGFPACVDARGRRTIEQGNVVLRRFVDAAYLSPDTLVVMALGANDVLKGKGWGRCQATTALSLAGDRRVLWVNSFHRGTPRADAGSRALNGEIDAVAAKVARLRVVDWHAVAGRDISILKRDRLHPNPKGVRVWAATVSQGVAATDGWHPGERPVSPACGGVTTTLTPTSGPLPQESRDGSIVPAPQTP